MNRFILLLCVFVSLKSWAVDPFEDFHEYGQLSEEEIHKIHQGELLYGDTEFGFIVSSGNTNSTSFKLKGNLYQDLENWRNQFKIDTLLKALNNVYEEDTSLAITDTSILTEVKSIPKKNVQKKVEERLNFNKKESFKPIYFGFDSYMVTDYSKSKLEKLIELLKASEVKYIVLNAYTDSRGGEEYNMKLSVKRALACRQYLISQGIQESKIKYTGFGESNRVNDCGDVPCSDERHKLNRRIEFTLLYN